MNYLIMILLGILIGSFLNVCIYRIPIGGSIIKPRSHCPKCGHVLGSLELIPIFSYIVLGKKCKVCKQPIASRYMWIEIVTGLGFGLIYQCYGTNIETLFYCLFFAFALVLTMIDWDQMLLPTVIIRWGIECGIIVLGLQGYIEGQYTLLISGLLGAGLGYGLFMFIYYSSQWFLKKEGLGYGDVRLMAFIGLFVGIDQLFLVLIVSCLLASIYGLILLKIKKKSEPYPLGPFLNAGAFLVILWGEPLIRYYVSLF